MGYSDFHQPYIKPPAPPPRPPGPPPLPYNKDDPFPDKSDRWGTAGVLGWAHKFSRAADKWIYNNRWELWDKARTYGPMVYRWARSPQGQQILGELEGLIARPA
jgi:hypothetical protein